MVKDISRVGRNLSEVVIIDCHVSLYKRYEVNGMGVSRWLGDKSDK